jgi:hypothetical protein
MENPLSRLSNIKNYYSNNETKGFTNLTNSKYNLKSSTVFNQNPIKRFPRLQSDIERNEVDVDILNTTNDKISEESEDKFDLNKERIEGSLICTNRIIEPIVSLKNQYVNESGKYGKLSKFLLNKGKNKLYSSKSPIENTNDFKIYLNNKSKNDENLDGSLHRNFDDKFGQSFNDFSIKNAIEETGYYAKNRILTNNFSNLNINKNIAANSNYNSNNFENKFKNEKENNKF